MLRSTKEELAALLVERGCVLVFVTVEEEAYNSIRGRLGGRVDEFGCGAEIGARFANDRGGGCLSFERTEASIRMLS